MQIDLTYTQARRLATSAISRVHDMDAARPANWETLPTECSLTKSDKRYRAELLDAYDTIMKALHPGVKP